MPPSRRDWMILAAGAVAVPRSQAADMQLPLVRSHLDRIVEHGTDTYGSWKNAMWVASLNTQSLTYPKDQPMAKAGRRVYREIAAPNGSTIYWDQPQLAAAELLSQLTGKTRYREAANAYIRDFLKVGIDEHGLFEWGNHRYWDIFEDKVVRFSGGAHEIRPLTPDWDLFWRVSPEATEREIRVAARRHVFDPETGGFNRHDDGERSHAFLEAGGILAESLCWLSQKVKDPDLVPLAIRIVRYSYRAKHPETGLIVNNPTSTRWDNLVSTTEAGVWANSLLRCAEHSGEAEFIKMAQGAVDPWLQHGWDSQAKRFYGQLRVKDATPVEFERDPGPTEYWPGTYSDIWNANFPTHDYPMAMAEACLSLYRLTKEQRYREGVTRWAAAVAAQPVPETARNGRGAYAECFGRAIRFLVGGARTLSEPEFQRHAHDLAGHAHRLLFTNGMFRGHAREDRYDAVDGVGYLLLALLALDFEGKGDYGGFK